MTIFVPIKSGHIENFNANRPWNRLSLDFNWMFVMGKSRVSRFGKNPSMVKFFSLPEATKRKDVNLAELVQKTFVTLRGAKEEVDLAEFVQKPFTLRGDNHSTRR